MAYKAYLEKLSEVSGVEIRKFADLIDALKVRHAFFGEAGCRLSDHGIEEFYAEDYTSAEIEGIFDKVCGGSVLTEEETAKFKTAMLVEFAIMDHGAGWTAGFTTERSATTTPVCSCSSVRTQGLTLSETSMWLKKDVPFPGMPASRDKLAELSSIISIRVTMNSWLR